VVYSLIYVSYYYYFAHTQVWQSGRNTGATNILNDRYIFVILYARIGRENEKKKKGGKGWRGREREGENMFVRHVNNSS